MCSLPESCEFIGALQSGLLSGILPLDEFVAVSRPVWVVPPLEECYFFKCSFLEAAVPCRSGIVV